jgi:hypothetical protein
MVLQYFNKEGGNISLLSASWLHCNSSQWSHDQSLSEHYSNNENIVVSSPPHIFNSPRPTVQNHIFFFLIQGIKVQVIRNRIIFHLQLTDYRAVHCICYSRLQIQNSTSKLYRITIKRTVIFVAASGHADKFLIINLHVQLSMPAYSIQEGLRFINLCEQALLHWKDILHWNISIFQTQSLQFNIHHWTCLFNVHTYLVAGKLKFISSSYY